MKCWAWEYFRTSVARRAIFFRREMDGRVLDAAVAAMVAPVANGVAAAAACESLTRNSRRVTPAWPASRLEEAMAGSVFIEVAADSAQFREASQRSARGTHTK